MEKFERLDPKPNEFFDRRKVAELIDAHSDAIEALSERLESTRIHTLAGVCDIFADGFREKEE